MHWISLVVLSPRAEAECGRPGPVEPHGLKPRPGFSGGPFSFSSRNFPDMFLFSNLLSVRP